MSAVYTYTARVAPYKFIRIICVASGASANIVGIKATYGGTYNSVLVENWSALQIVGQRFFRRASTVSSIAALARQAGRMVLGPSNALFPVTLNAIGNGATATITGVQLVSSNGAAAQKAQYTLYVFNSSAPSGITLTDNTAFNPTAAALASAVCLGTIGGLMPGLPASGAAAYGYQQNGLSIPVTAGSGGTIWILPVLNNDYTSVSGETLSIIISDAE